MTKTAKTETAAPASKPVCAEVTPDQLERCRRALHQKLARAIVNNPDEGEVGIISKVVADLRAIDLVEATRVPHVPAPPRVLTAEEQRIDAERRERQEAAANDAIMQKYNAKVAKREAIAAAREEGA